MGFKKSKKTQLIMLFIIMSFIPIQLAKSLTNVGTLNSSQQTQPTIDGNITDAEWSTAQELIITLYHHSFLSTTSIEITMMSTYDPVAKTISFAVIIPDATTSMGDYIYLVFNTSETEELIVTDPSFDIGIDKDIKGFLPDMNLTVDGATPIGVGFDDVSLGGTDDGSGKGRHVSGQYTIEMNFPLASNDTLGHDFNLTHDSQIDFTIIYFEDSNSYLQSEDMSVFEYCTLHILPRTNYFGIETIALITGLLSSILFVIIIRRKRN